MKTKAEYDKLRGGYYTPEKISRFISEWAINDTNLTILEPSCGDGSFVKEAKERLIHLGANESTIKNNILAVELDGNEASKVNKYNVSIINSDFFTYYKDNIHLRKTFDVVLGNPPFIRYQNFNSEYRDIAFQLMREMGFNPNKLTNIWLPFLILSSYSLNESGKIGMVIPAELFQVGYAAEARKFLSVFFEKLTIITFQKLLFDNAQQEVVILLGEKRSEDSGIRVIELDSLDDLDSLNINDINLYELKQIDHGSEKWIKYYLTNDEINLMRRLRNNDMVEKATDLFDVNVGIVSGQNDFFIMNKSKVEENNILNYTRPIIGRAEQVKGIILRNNDFENLKEQDKKVFMFTPNNEDYSSLSLDEKLYIAYGEKNNYDKGYKCKIRKRWYIVPQSWEPEAFLLRQVHVYPKMILNQTEASTTDTLHKIRFKDGISGENVACAFINSFTFALCEITGRSYGGGVLTFEPGEVRKLLIPMNGSERLDITLIDDLIRKNKIEEALEYNDKILLKDGLGLEESEILMLRNIWVKLRDRRINRKK